MSGVVVWTLLAGCPEAALAAGEDCANDQRCVSLQRFFERYGSGLAKQAAAFLATADEHKLDWRLLPGIAMVETSGGKHSKRNNVFGWNSGRTGFASIEAGIRFVGGRFAASPLYRGRTAMGILRAYNPARAKYPPKVTRFMLELHPDPVQ